MADTKPWEDYAPAAPAAAPSPPWVDYQTKGPGDPNYQSGILPISTDAQGNPQWDINAGITGSVIRAFKAPGDAYTGVLPVIGPDGHTTPEANARAGEFAAVFSPINPAVRAGDFAIPGVLRSGMGKPVAPPTALELKQTGGAQLDAARASGMELNGQAVADLGSGLKSSMRAQYGIIEPTAPKTHAVIDSLLSPPQGSTVTLPEIDAARRGLSDLSRGGGTEGLAAGHSVRQIDDFLGNLPDTAIATPPVGMTPEDVGNNLRVGRQNYATAMRSNELYGTGDANTGIMDRAAARAAATNSGMNLDNALRQRVASMLEKPKAIAGFNDAEIEALNNFVKGGALQNAARRVSNLAGGGGGLGAMVSGGIGAGLGLGLHGLPGAGMGAGMGALAGPAIGIGAKALENRIAEQRLAAIDAMLRSNSPMAQGLQANAPAWGGPLLNLGSNQPFLQGAQAGVAGTFPWGSIAPPPPPNKRR